MIATTRRPIVDDDPLIRQAINQIYATYGDKVTVEGKAKSLLKFGSFTSASASESLIGGLQSGTIRETYATSNSVDSIICDDSGTNTVTLTIEGHTISGSNLTFVVQNKALNSQTRAALDTPLARATRVYNATSTSFNDITKQAYVYDSTVATTPASGVPNVSAATKCTMLGSDNQSQKGGTSISSTDYWIITEIFGGAGQKANAEGQIRLRTRTLSNVFRAIIPPIRLDAATASFVSVPYLPYLIIPKNSDVELTFTGSTTAIAVSGGINGYLAQIVS